MRKLLMDADYVRPECLFLFEGPNFVDYYGDKVESDGGIMVPKEELQSYLRAAEATEVEIGSEIVIRGSLAHFSLEKAPSQEALKAFLDLVL